MKPETPFPRMYRVHQRFETASLPELAVPVREQLSRPEVRARIRPGQDVAVAVGSRGIHNLREIVAGAVACLKDMGLRPFVMPAMGSHGGATAEGQARVLAELGVTEASVGAPVVSRMDVALLGRLDCGAEVYCAQDALETDQVVVINRVKPHTAFRAEVESGLCKMLAIGLGRQKGAIGLHRYGLAHTIVPAARVILDKAPILCGIAVLEEPSGGTREVRLALPHEFVDVDRELLEEAWKLLPRIPLDDLDVLIVDEMGKDVSGAGMDPNVIGFWRREGGARRPDYRTLVVLDLTPASHGNATGIGMADLTTRRVMDQVDLQATYMNALTSGVLRSARLPVALQDDREAIDAAMAHVPDPGRVRMARILNTLALEVIWVTEAVLEELRARPGVEIEDIPLDLSFDTAGRLQPM